MNRLFALPPFESKPLVSVMATTLLLLICGVGCNKTDPIVTYTVPTKLPEQLQPGKDRMLASIVPQANKAWFFKVTGPEDAIDAIDSQFQQFVSEIEFKSGSPVLDELPDGWRRGGEKPMRFASIDVTTDVKQLDISISNLPRQDDWDAYVAINVNRWRGQLGLAPSEEKWAGGKPIEVANADGSSVWVDLLGQSSSSSSMGGPFAGGPFAGRPFAGGSAAGGPMSASGGGLPPAASQSEPDAGAAARPVRSSDALQFDRPEDWRDGKMSSMRLAAFNVGPESEAAEVTVMTAGGDLRANVARWIGQVLGQQPAADVVDTALEQAEKLDVSGRPAQRFLLTGSDADSGKAIDATIVPLDGGASMFIKMTGPVATVNQQRDALGSFLESLKF